MKLFSVLLLFAPGCLSRSYPQVGRIAPGEPFLPFERQQHNPNHSVSGINRAPALGSRALFPDDHPLLQTIAEGCSLIGMMSTRDEVAARFLKPAHTRKTAESPWTEWKSLKDWGYNFDEEGSYDAHAKHQKTYLDPVMRSLGLPELNVVEDGGSSEPRIWEHGRATIHDGVEYKRTKAWYQFFMDVEHGLLVTLVSYGPQYKGLQQTPPVTVLPKLKNLCDIMYLEYAHLAAQKNVPVNRLRYYMVDNVQNEETKAAVDYAIGVELTDWECHELTRLPRHTWDKKNVFEPDSEAYKALIASPSGRSAALLLATHKKVFGERRIIESVTFWCQTPDEINYNLLFTIKDHDEEEDDTDWEDEKESEDPGKPDFSVSPWPSATPRPAA
ncbi:hypothetical protein P171DRAFT_84972 [Karstenula rhodostoma CBS 690.94]|uniref:Uncharacterized protein n=1 Tax=Karstenula rhodostoma CBS 690.94 TaxID=1392251 RepID=A0A9P4PD69_9PLEO|nr:hypothetical protein P171DRAFT_84972 [Karstenula rhodostoma CBS 690.94]